MSTRNAVLLAVGTLIVGLMLGAMSGGIAGFFIGQSLNGPMMGQGFQRLPNQQFPNQQFPNQLPNQQQPNQQQPNTQRPNGGSRRSPFSSSGVIGAQVVAVDSGSPADKAGLQVNDVITAVDNTPFNGQTALSDLVQAHKPGDVVNLAVQRNNATQTISVTLGASPQNSTAAYLGIRYSPAF